MNNISNLINRFKFTNCNKYILLVFIISGFLQAKIVQKEVVILFTEESINNILFKHRIDIENGQKRESFNIDGRNVNKDEYHEAILKAEVEEIKQQRAQIES